MLVSKTCFAGLPLLFIALLYITDAQVKGAKVCKDLYSTCSSVASRCQRSETIRILCEKTCKVCAAEWMDWSQWNECSHSCGGGIRERERKCSIDGQCQDLNSENQQSEACKEQPCLDTGWRDWSDWETCSKTCGNGERERIRTCIILNQCLGKSREMENCMPHLCPEWTSWSPWSFCSRRCDGGQRHRTRGCTPEDQCGNLPIGSKQVEVCRSRTCPEWDKWSNWGKCSKTCGQGERSRTRSCNFPGQCIGDSKESKTCTTLAEKDCSHATYIGFAVDDSGSMEMELMGVTLWIETCVNGNKDICGDPPSGGWIITSFNDPDVGVVFGPTKNSQHILDAARSYVAKGGVDCPEMSLTALENVAKVVPNNARGCKVFLFTDATPKDFAKNESLDKLYTDKGCEFIPILTDCCGSCPPVEDYVENAFDFRTNLSKSRRRKRSTDDDVRSLFYKLSEKTGGKVFVVDKPSSQEVLVDFLKTEVTLGFCATSDLAGPNAEGYKCKEDCVAMKMCWDKSVRKCYCAGDIPCERRPIIRSESRCPEWMGWSSWSTCSHTCGDGKIQRRRRCSIEGKCRYMRPGSKQSQSCNVKPCPEWKKWNTWESCSKTCGEGEQRRIRHCTVPNQCKGDSIEAQKCVEDRICEKWMSWSSWSTCSHTCGDGKMQRRRKCSVEGECLHMRPGSEQSQSCNVKPCPEWMGWSSWSTCTHTCGEGKIQRRRRCSIEGKCRYMRPGSKQSQSCNVKPCPAWTDWSPWSSCDRSCGNGKRKKVRHCSVGGGCRSMTSEKEQIEECNVKNCSVVCGVNVTSERCFWFVIYPSHGIAYTEAEEICKKNGSTLAVFVNEEVYESAMKAIRANIPPERTSATYIWTGMTLNIGIMPRKMDHPPHRSWYDNKIWSGSWNSYYEQRYIQLAFDNNKQGMYNWYSSGEDHGVICQTKQPTDNEP